VPPAPGVSVVALRPGILVTVERKNRCLAAGSFAFTETPLFRNTEKPPSEEGEVDSGFAAYFVEATKARKATLGRLDRLSLIRVRPTYAQGFAPRMVYLSKTTTILRRALPRTHCGGGEGSDGAFTASRGLSKFPVRLKLALVGEFPRFGVAHVPKHFQESGHD
jgi:hypothetical protein